MEIGTPKELIIWTLDKLVECLRPFVEKRIREKGIALSNTNDIQVLLKAIAMQSYLFEPEIGRLEKNQAYELIEYRNRAYHNEFLTMEDGKRAQDTAYRLCKAVGCERIAELIKAGPIPQPPNPKDPYYFKFWEEVLRLMREQGLTNTKQQTPRDNYLVIPIGKSNYTLRFVFNHERDFHVELYLDNDDKGLNERRFEDFRRRQKEIESELGTTLSWQKLEERCACRIALNRSVTDREAQREELIEWGIKMFVKMRNVFDPLIREQVRLK